MELTPATFRDAAVVAAAAAAVAICCRTVVAGVAMAAVGTRPSRLLGMPAIVNAMAPEAEGVTATKEE
jgi:hypothetical protein